MNSQNITLKLLINDQTRILTGFWSNNCKAEDNLIETIIICNVTSAIKSHIVTKINYNQNLITKSNDVMMKYEHYIRT